jgi:chemotaxis protein CheZ
LPTAPSRKPARIGAGRVIPSDEAEALHNAITRTKEEIAVLRVGFLEERTRAAHELDAVVSGTEHATQQILTAAEEIEEAADTLSALLKREQEQALAQDIQDQIVRIFEACNFQDLAGQRITKVVAALRFVEDRVTRLMDIWGGAAAFKDQAAPAAQQPAAKAQHGPKLAGDRGHLTQAEVDTMFARD